MPPTNSICFYRIFLLFLQDEVYLPNKKSSGEKEGRNPSVFLPCLTACESVKEGIYPDRDVFPANIYPRPEKLSRKYLYALLYDR